MDLIADWFQRMWWRTRWGKREIEANRRFMAEWLARDARTFLDLYQREEER